MITLGRVLGMTVKAIRPTAIAMNTVLAASAATVCGLSGWTIASIDHVIECRKTKKATHSYVGFNLRVCGAVGRLELFARASFDGAGGANRLSFQINVRASSGVN